MALEMVVRFPDYGGGGGVKFHNNTCKSSIQRLRWWQLPHIVVEMVVNPDSNRDGSRLPIL